MPNNTMSNDVHIKTNPRSIAAVHRRPTSQTDVFENIPAGLAAVFDVLNAAAVAPVGPPTTVFHRIPDSNNDGDIAVRVPIAQAIDPAGTVEIVTISEETVAAAVHEGSYETLGDTYERIAAWIQQRGHQITGPSTETYFNSPAEVTAADLRTEVAFPVEVHEPH